MNVFVTIFYLSLICKSIAFAEDIKTLNYALFTSGPTGSFDSSGAVPAIELAEDIINADTSILPGYNLTHTRVVDTMCDRTESFKHYFGTVFPPNPTVLGLLGCGCSVASTPVAEIVNFNSISQISYSSSSIELNNRKRFPNFFRTYHSDADFAPGTAALVQYYGWKRIAFLTQDEGLFTVAFERLSTKFMEQGIEVDNRLIASTFPTEELNNLNFFFEERDFRIIFINSYSNIARKIICEAYKRGHTYPKYVFITYGWYQDRWWREEENLEQVNCTNDQIAEVLHRSLAVQLLPRLSDPDTATDTGLTPNGFDSLYREMLNTTQAKRNKYTYTFVGTVAYDALWTLALAINQTNNMIKEMNREEILNVTQCEGSDDETGIEWEIVPLENFTYSNQLVGCIIRWNLERTNFVGVTGRVKFDVFGTRMDVTLNLFQYRPSTSSLQRNLIAQIRGINETELVQLQYLIGESDETVFPVSNGGIPVDGTGITVVNTYHLALVILYYILAAVGIAFTTACLIFNFTQRKKKVVKLTSPNMNYFIILGAYILYMSMFIRVLPSIQESANVARCIISSITLITGYCFVYGAILAKMGRIYYIFSNPSTKKKKLKDGKLTIIVLVIAGFGALLAILQVAIPYLRPTPFLDVDTEFKNDSRNFPTSQKKFVTLISLGVSCHSLELGIRIEHLAYQCYSLENEPQSAWLGIIFIYLALLQVIGIVLAIQTRKVKIKLLNDSKYIAALIYISSIVLLLISIVTFVLVRFLNIGEAITSGGIFVISTLFLGLVFIPKMVFLYWDPEGEYVFNTGDITHGTVQGEGLNQMKSGSRHAGIGLSDVAKQNGSKERNADSSSNSISKEIDSTCSDNTK